MKLTELKRILAAHPAAHIQFVLPTGSRIPLHSHVADVARIDKRFIDCGGKIRSESLCRLQTWHSDDTAHRIAGKVLSKILAKAEAVLGNDDLEVDVEYEAPFISQFPVERVDADGDRLTIQLGTKHTECLAQDSCKPTPAISEMLASFPLPGRQPAKCCA